QCVVHLSSNTFRHRIGLHGHRVELLRSYLAASELRQVGIARRPPPGSTHTLPRGVDGRARPADTLARTVACTTRPAHPKARAAPIRLSVIDKRRIEIRA